MIIERAVDTSPGEASHRHLRLKCWKLHFYSAQRKNAANPPISTLNTSGSLLQAWFVPNDISDPFDWNTQSPEIKRNNANLVILLTIPAYLCRLETVDNKMIFFIRVGHRLVTSNFGDFLVQDWCCCLVVILNLSQVCQQKKFLPSGFNFF